MSTSACFSTLASFSLSHWLSHPLPTSSLSSTPSPYHCRTAVDRAVAVRTRQLADHEGSVRPPLPPSQTIPLLVPSSAVRPHSFSLSLSLSFSRFLSLFSPLSFSLFLSLHSSLFCFLAFISNDRRFVSSSSAARSTFQVDTARTRQSDALYRRRGIVIRRAVYVLSQSQTSQRDGTLADQRIATTHRLIGG